MQDYRKLRVADRAHAHTVKVRKVTQRFPRVGYTEFKNQITTAAESIPFNIVEGCGSSSNPEFGRFLQISIKSAFELEYQLKLAKDYEVLPVGDWQSLSKETVEIRKMLCGLRKKALGERDEGDDESNSRTDD